MALKPFVILICVVALGVLFAVARTQDGAPKKLVIYCGRTQHLVEPLIQMFEQQADVEVQVRYGKTAQLALALQEEGRASRVDVFWAQDAGALSVVSGAHLFQPLPEDVLNRVAEPFRPSGYWVATSGRARVLAYAPGRVPADEIPQSVFELTHPKWKGRVGWALTNSSFQAFVTSMRVMHGDGQTRQWLRDMAANGAKRYAKNSPIIRALADGKIDLGLLNHYYLLRQKKLDKNFPVEQRFLAPGDCGNLVNVAGLGILASSQNPKAAFDFARFALSEKAQQYFTSEVFEYPVVGGVAAHPWLVDQAELLRIVPDVKLDQLTDLKGTIDLLKEVGLL